MVLYVYHIPSIRQKIGSIALDRDVIAKTMASFYRIFFDQKIICKNKMVTYAVFTLVQTIDSYSRCVRSCTSSTRLFRGEVRCQYGKCCIDLAFKQFKGHARKC